MPTANVRYGRPKGSGLDDRRQLESIAALLAANPKLKPTTAIRSLGVEDPSTIRRLRDKLRLHQETPEDTRPPERVNGAHAPCASSNENTPVAVVRAMAPRPPSLKAAAGPRSLPPAFALMSGWCDVGLTTLSLAVATQAAFTQCWLGLPAVSRTMRAQMTLGSLAVAAYARGTTRPASLR